MQKLSRNVCIHTKHTLKPSINLSWFVYIKIEMDRCNLISCRTSGFLRISKRRPIIVTVYTLFFFIQTRRRQGRRFHLGKNSFVHYVFTSDQFLSKIKVYLIFWVQVNFVCLFSIYMYNELVKDVNSLSCKYFGISLLDIH